MSMDLPATRGPLENTFPIGVSSSKGKSDDFALAIVILANLRFFLPLITLYPASLKSFMVAAVAKTIRVRKIVAMHELFILR